MWDLNVDSARDEEDERMTVEEEEEEAVPTECRSLMEDSGTSNSSVVNADEAPSNGGDEDSSNNSSAFNFGILNRLECRLPTCDAAEEKSEVVTRQLFPVAGGDAVSDPCSGSSTTSFPKPQWLNLSGPEPIGQQKPKQQQQQQQQPPVRKSRRGPRSRSSQYRGVTFYRRTGRWESHIW